MRKIPNQFKIGFEKIVTGISERLKISQITLFWCSTVSLILALLSLPIWYYFIFAQSFPVEVQLAAPGVEIVKAYWQDTKTHPDNYTPIIVKPVESKNWNVKIEALGEKNSRSQGYETAILDISTPEGQADWSQAIFTGNWEMRDSPGSPQEKAAIAHSNKPEFGLHPGEIQSVEIPLEGGELAIKLFGHGGSGKVRVTVDNQEQELDLFHRAGLHKTLTFPAITQGDRQLRNYTIEATTPPWYKLKFIADEGKVNVKSVKVAGKSLSANQNDEYVLPIQFWQPFAYSLIAAIAFFLLIITILISASHIARGTPQKRLGTWGYIIGISILASGFWTFVYYPAIMSPDSLYQWSQAINNSYNDWHPPLMTLGMRATLYITDSPALFAFLQGTILYISIYTLIYCLLKNRNINPKLQLFCFCLLPFIPTIWNYTVTLWKDVWLCTSLILMLCSLLKLKETRKFYWFILYFVLFGISISLRKSAVFYFPFLVFESWIYLKNKLQLRLVPLILVFLIAIASPLGFPKGINYLTNAAETHQEGKAILFDIVGTYLHTKSPRPKEFEQLFETLINEGKNASYPQLLKFYTPVSGDDYVWHQEAIFNYHKVEENRRKLLKFLVFNNILEHPIAYLSHKSKVWSLLIGFQGWQYPYDYGIYEDRRIGLKANSKFPAVQKLFIDRILPGFQSFFLPKDFFYLLIILAIASWLIKQKKGNDRQDDEQWDRVRYYLPSLGVSLSLISSFMFITPVVNFRYIFASCVILISLSLVEFTVILQMIFFSSPRSRSKIFQLDYPSQGFQLLSIIIPVYNEEKTIVTTLQKIDELPIESLAIEVIIVDDCSQDKTQIYIKDFLEKYEGKTKYFYLRHDKNRGKGGALKTGFGIANGDILIVQDADLEYDSDEIPSVINPILKGKADIVYGSRFITKKASRVLYYYHYLANKFLTFLSNIFTNLNMTDIETGYKAFRSEIIKNMIIHSWGFGFEVEVTAKIAKLNCRVYEVPISYYGRTYEEGKKIGFMDGVRAIFLIFYYNLFVSKKKSFRWDLLNK
ncbi:glycosyltransferase [Spirulina sp. 06S082]|uniref:glycosyltransferase n=1 Tax=Spirulina sp. 06S082 TaxID=3110248 RepID=UPI002B207643|nr:glycosyltransferase [Spirulina sp. 06S082]MEA5470681.1 glycosyltransferase [Spirulina sp. 06S082]